MRLRVRIFAVVVPLVTLVVVTSGVFSSLQSRTALTRIANRHMVFKAEQLRDYFYSEWDVVSELGLADQQEYREASRESFRSYGYSLLRSTTEAIFVFGEDKSLVMRIGLQSPVQNEEGSPQVTGEGLEPGWFEKDIGGEARVGVVFSLEPIHWTVALTDLESAFFSDVNGIRLTTVILVSAAVLISILFLSIFIGHVLRPVERLTSTVREIGASGNLSLRARAEYDDEIGALADEFNDTISRLAKNYRQLEQSRNAEARARALAMAREEETLLLLGRVSDVRDEETGAHLRRIGVLSAELTRLLGENEEEQNLMHVSAPLHDIGKIGISEKILEKKGKLTKKEFETMKLHTLFGHDLLKDSDSKFLIRGAEIALTHHEKWDGSGYPNGLSGTDIPLCGRIVALVDVFDALTSERPYKEAWTPEGALKYIVEQKGSHFDPELVDVFAANFEIFRPLGTH